MLAVRELTKADRCDRCPAQAFVLASRDDLELQFCLHHSNRNADALQAQGWNLHVQDLDF